MLGQIACLLQLLFLAGLSSADHKGPQLTNLTETEIKYAHIYWKYKPTERITRDVGQPVGSRLTNLGYRFLVPSAERLAGITYVGHAARLRLALERARNGEALRIGALGGSITTGHGVGGGNYTYLQYFMDWLNAAMPPHQSSSEAGGDTASAGETGAVDPGPRRRVLHGWVDKAGGAAKGESVIGGGRNDRVGRIRRGLRGDGPRHMLMWPQRQRNLLSAEHSFLNGAVPGTMSGYTSSCLKIHLIPNPDLVFVEFTVNDSHLSSWGEEDSPRRPLERLLRKVLNLPSNPAVVLVNMFAMGPSNGIYWQTAEREFMEFTAYYGLPSVSLRAAVFPSATAGGAEEVSPGAIFNGGAMHPGRGGHVVVTELLITLCLEVALVAARPLPPPLFPGNHGATVETCYIQDQLQALVQQPVVGWNWTDEGRGKWGYVATEPGKTIKLKVNTQIGMGGSSSSIDGDGEGAELQPIIVQVAYLQSYRGMGTARLSCEAGCNCTSILLDAYDARPASLAVTVDIKVTQHSECHLELKSGLPSAKAVQAAKSGAAEGVTGLSSGWEGSSKGLLGYKFKLIGLVVGEDPGAAKGTVTFVRGNTADIFNRMQALGSDKPQKSRE
ncbi:hypothetical protein VOLCADRAFT_89683 [Volvox carteri f. nagariensis]|uniref:SGNH hydrolase-type esterase domain-containing protein n=1 Tax=Volvox carteri f. nagariensis TaxID=3068 RepID=D8TRT4_VOLCA|nr:uncharacterized protein VOLCADRAFT_89683 [Volvox carteri f. nagariensis]EFJ49700.1 hypothetical protein VOLCADRAFT_89683 [Volvox carteri f. nagariensis]|eukprot:XP_002949207.1 hypothetical protein VOLCADRAFT_89683 [Volvox carteri f. nagariensis]